MKSRWRLRPGCDKPQGRISDSDESTERELTLAFPRRHRLRGFYGNIFSSFSGIFFLTRVHLSLSLSLSLSSFFLSSLLDFPFNRITVRRYIYFHSSNCSTPIQAALLPSWRFIFRLLIFAVADIDLGACIIKWAWRQFRSKSLT